MEHSESIAHLAAALVKAHADVRNATKDATNPHFKSGYASLNSLVDTVKPAFLAHGLAVVQLPASGQHEASMRTLLIHESGEWLSETATTPIAKQDPQGIGSAYTYLRRYALAAIAQIAQEDDDGNAASHAPGERPARSHASTEADDMIVCPKCSGDMWDNRTSKTNPKAPDLKCKDKAGCDNAIWLGSWRDDLKRDIAGAHETGLIDAEQRDAAEQIADSKSPAKMLKLAKRLDDMVKTELFG